MYHLHTSRYSDIVPLHNPLTKVYVAILKLGFYLIGFTDIIWNQLHMSRNLSLLEQNMFFVEMESENCISTVLLLKRLF